ncbi:MAG: alpha/beta hydrolase [Dehalococcoidia bacterium]
MSEPRQQFFHSQRLKLSYWEWGSADNPPLVLLHGGRDHARSWDHIAQAFEAEYHVLALDLRGHGDSDWAPGGHYSVPDNMLDLVRLLEIAGPPAVVLGHSYGGQVTLAAAGTYPELFSKVIAIEGTASVTRFGYPDEMGPAWLRSWAEQVRGYEESTGANQRVYPTVEAAAARMREANPRLPVDQLPELARYAVRPVEGGFVWKFDNWVHARTSMEIRRSEFPRFWAAIPHPVLLFYGTESRAAQAPAEVPHFGDIRHVIVPEAAHWVHHDQPDTVIREMRAFLAG